MSLSMLNLDMGMDKDMGMVTGTGMDMVMDTNMDTDMDIEIDMRRPVVAVIWILDVLFMIIRLFKR